ncbi:MAG: HEAT repeat domain-containing protein [Planctomycetaceae bacterium]|nr:HEAT repeat domain-containing protein [Planctomycetaceae bacterium]
MSSFRFSSRNTTPGFVLVIGAIVLILPFALPTHALAQSAPKDARPTDLEEKPPEIADSAAVKAIRATNPTTPEELMHAIDLLIRLDRSDLALDYLKRLASSGLKTQQLSQLHQRFGTSTVLRLTNPELAPEGPAFAQLIFNAAKTIAQNPQRIAADIADLGSAQREQQLKAARRLLRSGAYAVPSLINAIASSKNSQIVQRARTVLTQLGDESTGPLIAFLSSSNPQLRLTAIEALGRSGSRGGLPYLVYPYLSTAGSSAEQAAASQAFVDLIGSEPLKAEANTLLERAARRAYDGLISQKADLNGLVLSWTWDEKLLAPVPYRLLSDDAAALAASRLYRDLHRLNPENKTDQIRSFISRFKLDQAIGLDRPLRRGPGTVYDDAKQAGVNVVNAILQQSLKDKQWLAAIGATDVLAAFEDPRVLQAPAGQVAPLVLALTDPNRRVRFAAAKAIMQIDPQGSFAGASRLPQALGYFAGSTGNRKILVLHPSAQHGQTLGGLANQAGFTAEVLTEPTEMVNRAIQSPDWELIMISDAIRGPSLWSLITALRADPKSADIPIVLLGFRSDSMLKLDQIADAHPRTLAAPEPIEDELFGQIVARGLNSAGRTAVDVDRRLEQAALALDWLTRLSREDPNRFSTLLRQQPQALQALYTPELFELATNLVARLPTSEAQLALTDVANLNTLPVKERQMAVKAFGKSVQAFGLLLNQAEIKNQYDRYNRSEKLDTETQSILGALLDSIESPILANTQTPTQKTD